MEELKISDLPKYAKKSNMYKGMDEIEMVSVPSKFLIYDETIINFKDYKKLIKSYRYFVTDLSDDIIKFQNDPKNKYDVLKFFIKNKDDAFFKEQLNIFECIKIKIRGNFIEEYFSEYDKDVLIYTTFIFENESSKVLVEDGIMRTSECHEYLENIKNLVDFEIKIGKNDLCFNFKNGVVFADFYQEDKEYAYLKFKLNVRNLNEVFEGIYKNMKKCEKLIESRQIFGISYLGGNHKNIFDVFCVGILKKDDLIFGNVDYFFENNEKIKKGITKKNIKEYLENNDKIVYF